MPISERTLRKWRQESLIAVENEKDTKELYRGTAESLAGAFNNAHRKILKMTQELLDQHLMRKE